MKRNNKTEGNESMNNKEFKPYIAADKVMPEMTTTSVILGIVLAVVFGAANAYLGLRVGMTVSASIPAAIISMAVTRVILKRNSILESNMVQTIGSAGESLAAGAIFTLPVLYLWAKEGLTDTPSVINVAVIAILGGILGVVFMVPLRNALIVKEHGVLPYPEGTACAEVLLVGEKGGSSAKPVFSGMGIAALIKFVVDGLKVTAGAVTVPVKTLKTELSSEIYPALIGVGYICGPQISAYMLAGGLIGWFVLIPAITIFGGQTVMFPASISISELYETGGASAIWSQYIRYIGAGAVAAAGIISLCKTLPLIASTFAEAVKGLKTVKPGSSLRTEEDIDIKYILMIFAVVVILIWVLPEIPISFAGAILVAVFGFFFATVSARMVGLVGSSNNPVSGMTIATLLITTVLLKATGDTGVHGMTGAISIGSIICICTCMAGDMSQDLKTGYVLGATPKKQQIGELIGTLAAGISIGFVMIVLNRAWGFGSDAIPAPQATLMKMIIEGVMNGNLPWELVFIGAFITVVFEIIGVSALPIAIGLYLPFRLSAAVMLGGLTRMITDKVNEKNGKDKETDSGDGILFCSGMIAGEGLVGVLMAFFAISEIDKKIDLSGVFSTGQAGAAILLALTIALVAKNSIAKKHS